MKKIIFVSRLDSDCSLGAYLLCEISLKLAKIYPDLQIVIVGGGSEYEKIHLKAQEINAVFSRELIVMVGETQSPCKYFTRNSIFVGVSRAALEAMAHGLPVILLGNEGYIGIFNESNLQLAKETNFTCRRINANISKKEISAKLFNDICYYFSLPQKDKDKFGSFSLEIINKEYSSQKMARQTLEFYQKIISEYHSPSKASKIAICGYYGKGNFGDEAILSILKKKIKEISPNIQTEVLNSKNPLTIFSTLHKTDLFIFGGGSLLQNSTSNASLFYYLFVIHLANLLCKRKIMLANGIGPIKKRVFSKKILTTAIKHTITTFDFISTRDTKSQKYLLSLLPKRKINLIPDPALIYFQNLNCELTTNNEREYFSFIPCTNGIKNNKFPIKNLANLLLKIEKSLQISPAIIVLNFKEDMNLAKILKRYCPNAKIYIPTNEKELLRLLKKSEITITQRYHGALFSSICGIPTLAISDDPKMTALCQELMLFPAQNSNSLGVLKELENTLASVIAHHKKFQSAITEQIDRYSKKSNRKIKNVLSKFISPLDKHEHLFYNIENDS